MNILNTVEREAFDSPPMFNGVERKHYFDFPTGLRRLAGNLRTPIHRLGFLLSAGYFKAAKRFFPPRTFVGLTRKGSILSWEFGMLRVLFSKKALRLGGESGAFYLSPIGVHLSQGARSQRQNF